MILNAISAQTNAKYLLLIGDGINQIDASGEEVVRHLVNRLQENGMVMVFSGLKRQVLMVMRATGLFELIGDSNIFATEQAALSTIYERLGRGKDRPLFVLS